MSETMMQEDNTEDKKAKVSKRYSLTLIAEKTIMLYTFLLPIFFLPTNFIPFGLSKMLIFTLGALIPLFFWIISHYKNKTLYYPHSLLALSALSIPAVYFISALFSSNIGHSLVGGGYQQDTVLFVLLGSVVTVLTAILFRKTPSILQIFTSLHAAFSLIAVVQLSRVFIGGTFLSGILGTNVTNSLFGSWNDMAVFAGLIIIISTATFVYKIKGALKVFAYINTVLALILLSFINLFAVWVLLALFGIVFAVYAVVNIGVEKKDYKLWWPLATVTAFAIVFIFVGNIFSGYLNNSFNVNFLEVRPSWGGTVEVMKSTYDSNFILGTGPNTFSQSWDSYKPDGVNSSYFWNTAFNSGIGYIPTAFVTTGILGGIAWVLFAIGIMYYAFRALWVNVKGRINRYSLTTLAFMTVYSAVILFVYVPQTALFGLLFLLFGLFIAILKIVDLIELRKIETKETKAAGFISTLIVLSVSFVSIFTVWVLSEKILVSTLIQSAGKAVAEKNIDRARDLVSRAVSIARIGIGDHDNVLIASSQIATIKLNEALSSKEELSDTEKTKKISDALRPVILPIQEAIESSPNKVSNYLYLGEIYERLASIIDGAEDQAMNTYQKAFSMSPHNPEILLRMARIALVKDSSEEGVKKAKQYIAQALDMKRNYLDGYYMLSQIAIKTGDTKQAIATTEAAITLAPSNAGLLFQLGVLQYSSKDYKKAVVILERAVQINSQYANAIYYLGLTYKELGEEDKALKAFEAVARLNPENKEIKKIISSIKFKGESKPVQPQATSTQKTDKK